MSESCETCGAGPDQPHERTGDDCDLDPPHLHAPRFVGRLCRRHYGWVSQTLTEIVTLYALLPDVLEPSVRPAMSAGRRHAGSGMSRVDTARADPDAGAARRGRAGGSAAAHSPAPGRLAAMAITDRRGKTPIDLDESGDDWEDVPDVLGTLESWLHQVDVERRLLRRWTVNARGLVLHESDALADGRLPLTRVVGLLHAERRWIAAQDWVADYAAELDAVHRALARAVGDSMWPRSIGRCPNCAITGVKTPLYVTAGLDVIRCRRCKNCWSGVHYLRLLMMLEETG